MFGISGDKPSELKKFKEDQNLQYDLLSDENNILRCGLADASELIRRRFCCAVQSIGRSCPCQHRFQCLCRAKATDVQGLSCRKTFGIKNALFVLPGRQTYVINKNGECIMSFNDMTNTSQHITEALQALGI